MADKTPVKATFTGSNVTGLAEFQTSDTIAVADGGTGLGSLGSAGQVLKVNSSGNALEYGNVEAVINIDGMLRELKKETPDQWKILNKTGFVYHIRNTALQISLLIKQADELP